MTAVTREELKAHLDRLSKSYDDNQRNIRDSLQFIRSSMADIPLMRSDIAILKDKFEGREVMFNEIRTKVIENEKQIVKIKTNSRWVAAIFSVLFVLSSTLFSYYLRTLATRH